MNRLEKQRLDVALYQRGMVASREKARAMVMAGEVFVNGTMVDKPGTRVTDEDDLVLRQKPRFVSRGGEKLAGALEDFKFQPEGLVCADVGASTGGFTDCLLQRAAKRVYAIDVGYGQLDYTLRQQSSVVVMERTNARYVESLPETIDLVVIDASFISLRLLLPVVRNWMRQDGHVIALVKPQFEAGKDEVGKRGVVRDPIIHQRVLQRIVAFAEQAHFSLLNLTVSPIKGPAGNIEFLALFCKKHPHPDQMDTTARDRLIRTLTMPASESGIISDHDHN